MHVERDPLAPHRICCPFHVQPYDLMLSLFYRSELNLRDWLAGRHVHAERRYNPGRARALGFV